MILIVNYERNVKSMVEVKQLITLKSPLQNIINENMFFHCCFTFLNFLN